MKDYRSIVIRGVALIFGLTSWIPVVFFGPYHGYHQIDFVHCWFHVIVAILAILASIKLATARLFFQISAVVFTVFLLAGWWYGGYFLSMHFGAAENIAHIILVILSIYLGYIL